MEVEEMDMFQVCGEDGNVTAYELQCPICGKAWIREEVDGERSEIAPCKHLKFMWYDCGGETFGKWSTKVLDQEWRRAYEKVHEEEWPEKRYYISNGYDWDVIAEIRERNLPNLRLYSRTESGLACGPVSFTTIYGVVIPKKRKK